MNDLSQVESIFLAALEQESDEACSAYLDDACKDNPGLREQVNCLLAAHPRAVKFMGQPASPAKENTAAYVPTAEQVGTILAGRYKLLEMIGEGGMGEVWVADQLEPIRRRVALKLIKPGMDSRSVLARFEAERQALALMDHPNIAKVLDAGTAADGRPYFVMELVMGTPITSFCDARKLSARERLELFVPVCQAIQHAHTKGIIHRDIKPSNVLVALHDERPVPKVIDFGVAKAVGQQLTEKTIYTGFGGLVGTPAYMAPEQATFNQLDIDTRADVYALGVLLYELLAGSPPVEAERMRKAALDEVLRLVREEEPPRPSHRLSTSQSKASIAAVRQTDPTKLTKLIQGELDWIVMKALEKDRTRRYETANGFAADVQRYLSGEPVQAVPPSTAYRLKTFVKRHKARVIGATAFLLLLVTSVVVSSWLAVIAKRAADVAEEKRREAETNADRASAEAIATARAKFELMEEKLRSDAMVESLQVDLDLIECRTDARVGLLRLARQRKDGLLQTFEHELSHGKLNAEITSKGTQDAVALREFVTAAVLATGQRFAPLLPPITHDGHEILNFSASPDRRTLLTFGADGTARLWDTRAARIITILRHGTEQVVSCGFSPDGHTLFTDDVTGVVRVWESPAGNFLAQTAPRPNRYRELVPNGLVAFVQGCVRLAGDRVLTGRCGDYVHWTKPGSSGSTVINEEPIELWDAKTGRLVGRLSDRVRTKFQLLDDGRWVTGVDDSSAPVVYSAVDGRLIRRLGQPGESVVACVTPSGRRLASITMAASGNAILLLWDTNSWNTEPDTMPLQERSYEILFFSESVFGVEVDGGLVNKYDVYRYGQPIPLATGRGDDCPARLAGDLLHVESGTVIDTRTGRRVRPPAGRKFPVELAKLTLDGRFIATQREFDTTIIDTLTEKEFRFAISFNYKPSSTINGVPGLGLVGFDLRDGIVIQILPSADLWGGIQSNPVAPRLSRDAGCIAMNELSIFLAALEKDRPSDREAYLDQVCHGEPALRQRLERLLHAHKSAGGILDHPSAVPLEDLDDLFDKAHLRTVAEQPGAVIGPYKLLETIGEGGFGVVYMAEQERPVRRKVAFKVLKPGMDTRQVIARFEAERQALALMDHPHIAKVFDGGETASGRPYFVMELVRGVPITRFCDQDELDIPERLELFISVCKAVQHAHQKGVIHRDLKPSNVLVTLYDGKPVVKVIDFGIAKAIDRQQLTDKTLFTHFAQLMGTPLYMSPEQAELSGLDVDTRTDIYSLGVLLYELLTGTTPFERARLTAATFDEMRRIIREQEPPKPSTRISTLGLEASTESTHRKRDPGRLSQLVRGELDWIAMKALEKDRNRRYESAAAFAADVQRYLDAEPVEACPPSAWYKFRKLAQRNRGKFGGALAAALAVVLAVVGLAVSNALIRAEKTRTQDETIRAREAQQLAEARAEEIRLGLQNLRSANAWLDRGRGFVDEQAWDEAHAAFSQAIELRGDHVSAWSQRGDLNALLGLWDLAAADFTQEHELQEPHTAWRWHRHALLRLYVGDVDGFRQLCGKMHERFHGTSNVQCAGELIRTCVLAPNSAADSTQLVELAQRAVAPQPRNWLLLYYLGLAHYRAGQHAQAIQRFRESLDAEPNVEARFLSYPVLAMAYHDLGRKEEARQTLDEAARTLDRWTTNRYEATGGRLWLYNMGAAAYWPVPWWDWLEFAHYYRAAKLQIDGVPPPDDPRLVVLRARSFAGLRWQAQAIAEYTEALKQRPDDRQLQIEAHRNRAYLYVHYKQFAEAAAEFAQASELQPDDIFLWSFRATAHLAAADVDAYRKTCATIRERFAQTSDARTACQAIYVCVLRDDALADPEQLLSLLNADLHFWHMETWVRGAALYRAHRYDEAVECLEAAAKVFRPRAWEWCFLAMARHRQGHSAEARRCLTEAARWIEEADHRETGRWPDHDLNGTRPHWGDCYERVVFPMLYREAQSLMDESPGKQALGSNR